MDENNVVPEVPVEEVVAPEAEVPAEEVATPEAEVVETPAEEVVETPAEEVAAEPVADVPVLKFAGQVVVTDGTRTVEGREMHHLTLVDGSSQDVSDEDYAAAVEASK